MATPSANATILCTECNHQSTFPKVYLSMGTRKSFTYFCGNCGTVTLHTIHQIEEQPTSGRGAEGAEPARGASLPANNSNQAEVSPSPSGGVNRFRYDPVRHAANRQLEAEQSQGEAGRVDDSPVDLSTEELWGKLTKMLDDSQVPLVDLFRCDDTTRMRMFAALGFEKYEQERLLILSKERDTKNSMVINSPTPAPPANVPGAAYGKPPTAPGGLNTSSSTAGGAPNTSSYGLYGLQGSSQPSMPTPSKAPATAAPYVGWKPSQVTAVSSGGVRAPLHSARAPSIPGVYMNGEHMVARCTVYPELPAEFWCCACNVLVSSRCHVQGIHKDHPFISMRLAAETYVRDTAAWADRCRTQLNIVNTVIGNLQHSHGVLDQAVHHQFDALDKSVDQMVRDIYMWRDQLKADVAQQVTAEHLTIEQATAQAHALHELYNEHLKEAEPLLGNMPPATQHDGASDDWALKFLDFVTRLKHVSTEPVTMPKILVPEIRCTFSTPMVMDLLKHVNNPISIRLPDIIDPGYFHYPHPTASTRTPFVLALPQDGRQKGVVVENGRTLTRAQDIAPSHTLVTGSQIFYSGTNSWEVHVDRVGQGVGRILAGVIIQGSDGEGVVWDGYRIVGPNEGESRTISEKYKIKPGSVLRFVLELDAPNNYLNCFFEREGVARIPLPAASSGWVPAFSVFGPQDQITVVPTQGAGAMEGSIPKGSLASSSLASLGGSNTQQIDLLTKAKLEQQELMIARLQKQLETIATKIEAKGSAADTTNSARPQYSNPNALSEREAFEWIGKQRMQQFQQQQQHQQPTVAADQTNSFNFRADSSIPLNNNVTPGRIATPALPQGGQQQVQYNEGGTQRRGAGGVASHYSPELAQLLKFVDEIK